MTDRQSLETRVAAAEAKVMRVGLASVILNSLLEDDHEQAVCMSQRLVVWLTPAVPQSLAASDEPNLVTCARMGHGVVSMAEVFSPEIGEPGITWMELAEPRPVGLDTDDVYPEGSRAQNVLAYVSFANPEAIDQTIVTLQRLKAKHFPDAPAPSPVSGADERARALDEALCVILFAKENGRDPYEAVYDLLKESDSPPVADTNGDEHEPLYLVTAWGETQYTCAEIVAGLVAARAAVLNLMFLQPDEGDMLQFDHATADMAGELDAENEWEITFEIGGIKVQRIEGTGRAALAPTPTGQQALSDEQIEDALANDPAFMDFYTDGRVEGKADKLFAGVRAILATAAPRPSDDELWDQTLQERDHYHEMADKMASAIALHLGVDIGEHSNANCPWDEALEAIENATAAPAGDKS